MSSNIVGYEKINVPANKMDIVGIQFQDVGVNGVIDIQQITAEGWDGEGADWIKIYDPDTSRYVTAYYMGEEAGGVYDEDGNALGPGWADDNQVAVDLTIAPGQAVWTQSEAGGKFVVSGEVTANNEVEVPVNKMTLVANPLPMAVDIQQITTEGWDGEGADWIKIYNPDTSRYTTAYYMGEEAGGVYDEDGNALGPGWADDNQVAVDIEIKVGQGFWVQSEAGGKLVFPTIPAN